MVIFEKVKFRNFLSFGNYWSTIELNKNSSTCFIGKNGNGKSVICDLLCFALFGKPFRNINKPLLVNSINNKDCVVQLEFTTNERKYKIIRGIKPNVFEIYQNGVLIDQEAATKDYQEYLEKNILRFNYKSFTQIVILGSASFVPFMQLSASDRRSIIEDILDIQIFSVMNNILKEKYSNNNNLINNKKNQLELLRQKLSIEKKHREKIISDNKEKIDELKKESLKITEYIDRIIVKNNELIEKESNIREIIKNKTSPDDSINKLNKLEAYAVGKLNQLKKEFSFLSDNDICPICKQYIQEEFKVDNIGKIKTEEKLLLDGLDKLKKNIKREQTKINELNKKLSDLHNIQIEISSNNSSIKEKNNYITRIFNEIEKLKHPIEKKVEIDLSLLEDELKLLNDEYVKLSNMKGYYEYSMTMLKDSGIKSKIIKQYLPVINKLVNKYLSDLDFFVNFELDEMFKETIKSRNRDSFSYSNFSEGQKQRIDMALMLTWRDIARLKNSTDTNLLILDEIFDKSLDDDGADCLFKVLSNLKSTNLIVMSHRGDTVTDKFDSTLNFKMSKNFSRIS